jgi:zinc protease
MMPRSSFKTRAVFTGGVLAAAIGCSPGEPAKAPAPPPFAATTPAPTAERESPPPSGAPREFRIPRPVWQELPSGLRIATVESKALPVVQIRVMVLGGKAGDGEKPGLALLTGEMLKAGGSGPLSSRDLVTRVESLGASLSIDTGFDKTVLGMAVTKQHLNEAMGLLGTVVGSPQFSGREFDKLKKRETDRTADAARSSGQWGAAMVLYRELFSLPTDRHPYASYDTTPVDLAKITVQDCRTMHRRFFVPKNTVVVVAGDVTPAEAKAAVEKAFAAYRGGEPPVVSFSQPNPPERLKITLVDRPKSSQSDVFVGALGPERSDKSWAAFAVSNQVLGGGPSGRLFHEIREKQSLAYNASSSIHELGHAPSLLIGYVGTQTPKTGLALKGLLAELERLGTTTPTGDEVSAATRYLGDVLAIRLETIGAVADEVSRLRGLNLPDDYNDVYRKELRDITPAFAGKVASEYVRRGHHIVVVAGDAGVIGPMLSRFGEVKVVDPTRNFDRVRTIPMDPNAPLEAGK